MSSRVTGIADLESAVKKAFTEYEKATYLDIKTAADKTAKEIIKRTKAGSPRKTGEYRKGWRSTVEKANSRQYETVVHNSPKYRLTHLLEHGHGGPAPAPAHPHIVPDEETEKLFEINLRRELEG